MTEYELRSTGALLLRSEDERTLSGVIVPYGSWTKVGGYSEQFQRGAFKGTDPSQVPLLVSHRHADLPVGRTLTLDEGTVGLTGEWKLSETREADEVLSLARDGVPLGLSLGFQPIEDQWKGKRVTRVRARLGEVSVVGVPQYSESMVSAVRSSTPRLDAARLLRR